LCLVAQECVIDNRTKPWITPSLFDDKDESIVDEYTFCQYQDHDTAHSQLVNHWDTWITKEDFVNIKNAGYVNSSVAQCG